MNDELQKMWTESSQLVAQEFLRRTIRPDASLAEIKAALDFEGAKDFLGNLRLRDVLAGAKAHAAAEKSESKASPRTGTGKAPRRKMRARATTAIMKRLVLHFLADLDNGALSGEIGAALKEAGHSTDSTRTYMMLKAMQAAGHITSEGDKRKRWSVTTDGRHKMHSN
jgi:hypothetical protein